MNEQLALTFERPTPTHPRLAELVGVLRGRGWLNRRDLEPLGFNDRELREIVASDTDGTILSFPGSKGYRLFDEATLDEIRHADALKHQGERMTARWTTYQRRLHRRGGPSTR